MSVQERSFKRVAREQFDAFERQERLIRMEERRDRAAQLRLPTNELASSSKVLEPIRQSRPVTVLALISH
jgi:hypothetical protein